MDRRDSHDRVRGAAWAATPAWAILSIAACSAPGRPPASAGAVTASSGAIVAEAGPTVFDASPAWLKTWPWDEYLEVLRPHPFLPRLARPDPRASSAARYGTDLLLGGKISSWMIDGDAASGY